MAELFAALAKSAVGVLLLSPSYLDSKYCQIESAQLYRASIEGSVRLLPVCVERVKLPEPLQSLQYRALYQSDAAEIVADLVRDLQRDESAGERPELWTGGSGRSAGPEL